jgi:hypothetical protein
MARLVDYVFDELDELNHAYAVTITARRRSAHEGIGTAAHDPGLPAADRRLVACRSRHGPFDTLVLILQAGVRGQPPGRAVVARTVSGRDRRNCGLQQLAVAAAAAMPAITLGFP